MNNKFVKNTNVPLSLCDSEAKLSITSMFTLFMDIATEHADELNLSSDDLGENKFWIAVRTKIKINSRPRLSDKVTLATWPQEPVRVRANRHYTISDDNGIMIGGKTEWTVVDVESSKLQRIGDVYPDGFTFSEELAVEESFSRMDADFSEATNVAEYLIKSTDIDLVGHMNNAAYIRALMGIFTCEQLKTTPVSEIEIVYRAQSYEGEILTIKERKTEEVTDYGMIKPDGTVAAIVRIVK